MFSFHDEQLNQETYTSRYVCLSFKNRFSTTVVRAGMVVLKNYLMTSLKLRSGSRSQQQQQATVLFHHPKITLENSAAILSI